MGSYSTSERTRQALIEAAGELVAVKGVGGVSTRAIVEKAGENLGTIHYHFGSKEALFKAMLRFACQQDSGPSLAEVLEPYTDRLDDAQAQAEVVREIVRFIMLKIFSPDRPRWCSRVVYQVHQHAGPLRDYLREETLDPFFETLSRMVRAIRPDWTHEEIYLWVHLTIGSCAFHADHIEVILERLGTDTFTASYLAKLERRVTTDALRALGLPEGENTRE